MKSSVFICASSLCCCLLVCALVRMISPTGSTNKIMNVVISAFVLCCLFSPVADLVKGVNTGSYEYKSNPSSKLQSKEYDERVILHTSQYISEYLYNILSSSGFEVTQVKTQVMINDENSIYVSDVYIYLYEATSSEKEEIISMIYSELAVKPKILESKYGE